ncbi:NSE4A [Scenedesmus sp. PABB004]|nr:NSE4A [Scenedesmus sp. PABB004]
MAAAARDSAVQGISQATRSIEGHVAGCGGFGRARAAARAAATTRRPRPPRRLQAQLDRLKASGAALRAAQARSFQESASQAEDGAGADPLRLMSKRHGQGGAARAPGAFQFAPPSRKANFKRLRGVDVDALVRAGPPAACRSAAAAAAQHAARSARRRGRLLCSPLARAPPAPALQVASSDAAGAMALFDDVAHVDLEKGNIYEINEAALLKVGSRAVRRATRDAHSTRPAAAAAARRARAPAACGVRLPERRRRRRPPQVLRLAQLQLQYMAHRLGQRAEAAEHADDDVRALAAGLRGLAAPSLGDVAAGLGALESGLRVLGACLRRAAAIPARALMELPRVSGPPGTAASMSRALLPAGGAAARRAAVGSAAARRAQPARRLRAVARPEQQQARGERLAHEAKAKELQPYLIWDRVVTLTASWDGREQADLQSVRAVLQPKALGGVTLARVEDAQGLPRTQLSVVCRPEDCDDCAAALLQATPATRVSAVRSEQCSLPQTAVTVETRFGGVTMALSLAGSTVRKATPDWAQCAAAAAAAAPGLTAGDVAAAAAAALAAGLEDGSVHAVCARKLGRVSASRRRLPALARAPGQQSIFRTSTTPRSRPRSCTPPGGELQMNDRRPDSDSDVVIVSSREASPAAAAGAAKRRRVPEGSAAPGAAKRARLEHRLSATYAAPSPPRDAVDCVEIVPETAEQRRRAAAARRKGKGAAPPGLKREQEEGWKEADFDFADLWPLSDAQLAARARGGGAGSSRAAAREAARLAAFRLHRDAALAAQRQLEGDAAAARNAPEQIELLSSSEYATADGSDGGGDAAGSDDGEQPRPEGRSAQEPAPPPQTQRQQQQQLPQQRESPHQQQQGRQRQESPLRQTQQQRQQTQTQQQQQQQQQQQMQHTQPPRQPATQEHAPPPPRARRPWQQQRQPPAPPPPPPAPGQRGPGEPDGDAAEPPDAVAAQQRLRRELRQRFFIVERKLVEQQEALLRPGSDGLARYVDKVVALGAAATRPREAAQQTGVLATLSALGAVMMRAFQHNSGGRRPADLVAALAATHAPAPRAPLDWPALAAAAGAAGLWRAAPGLGPMLGPLQAAARARAAPAQRRARQAVAARVEPIEAPLEQEGETQETDRWVEAMRAVTAAHPRARLAALVVNHSSFSQSVENLFALSFLVKDGWVRLEADGAQGLMAVRVARAAHGAARRGADEPGGGAARQFVFGLDAAAWRLMCAAVAPREALMPHRAPAAASARARG